MQCQGQTFCPFATHQSFDPFDSLFRFPIRLKAKRKYPYNTPFVEESYFVIMCGIIGLLLADEDTCVSR